MNEEVNPAIQSLRGLYRYRLPFKHRSFCLHPVCAPCLECAPSFFFVSFCSSSCFCSYNLKLCLSTASSILPLLSVKLYHHLAILVLLIYLFNFIYYLLSCTYLLSILFSLLTVNTTYLLLPHTAVKSGLGWRAY